MISRLEQPIDPVCHDRVMAIGYGNPLRSDDGAGQKVAEILSRWHVPQMRSISVHQLTPELAALLAEAELAIFIDVYQVEAESQLANSYDNFAAPCNLAPLDKGRDSNPKYLLAANDIRVISIDPPTYQKSNPSKGTGHIADPHSLLYLTNLVYGKAPAAWWILIPAVNFEFGDRLSTLTTAGIARAIPQIKQIVQEHQMEIIWRSRD
jgi:hydrogenase maturation protease